MASDLGWKVFGGSSIPKPVDSAGSREAHPVIATVDPDAGLPPPALNTLFAEAHAATGAEDLAALMQRLMALVMAQTRAQRCVLLVTDPMHGPTGEAVESQRIEAECTAGGPVHVLCGERLVDQAPHAAAAPQRAVNFVVNSRQRLTLADVSREVPFDSDPAVMARQIRSLLCLPLRQPGRLLGVFYLENLPDPDLLAPEQVDAATLLATQAALSVQNAWLLENAGGGGRDERAVEPEAQAPSDAGAAGRWSAARMRQAWLHMREGRWVEANAQVDEALALAHRSGDEAAWRAVSLGFGAELAVLPAGLARCQVIAQQTQHLPPAEDDQWQIAKLLQRAKIAWLQGRLDQVLQAQHLALALAPHAIATWTTQLNDLVDLVVSAHTARREYNQAQEALDMQAMRLRHSGSGPMRTARLLFRQARLDWLRGKMSASSGLARARQFFAAQPDHPWAGMLSPTLAGMAALADDRPDLAEHHLRQASATEAATPAAGLLVKPSLLLAAALHTQGATDAALDVLTPVLQTTRPAHVPGLLVQEGAAVIPVLRLAAQQGRCGPAAAHVLGLLGVSNVARRLLVPETGIVLSPREVDVLELLAADAPNRAIAERLDVDLATVKSHVTRVLAKLGVRTRYEAAERGRALGLGNGW